MKKELDEPLMKICKALGYENYHVVMWNDKLAYDTILSITKNDDVATLEVSDIKRVLVILLTICSELRTEIKFQEDCGFTC